MRYREHAFKVITARVILCDYSFENPMVMLGFKKRARRSEPLKIELITLRSKFSSGAEGRS